MAIYDKFGFICCFFLSELLNIPLKDVEVFIGEEGSVTYNISSTDYKTVNETTTASFQNTLNNMGGSGIFVSDVQIEKNIVAKTVGND